MTAARRLGRWIPWLTAGVMSVTALWISLAAGGGDAASPAPAGPPAATASAAASPTVGQPDELSRSERCWLGVVLPDREVELLAEVPGRMLRIDVRPGESVTPGQLLAVIDSGPAQHQLAAERAAMAAAGLEHRRLALELQQAERDLERARQLDDLLSRQDLDAAAFRVATAQARLEVAGAERRRVEARTAELEAALERSEIRAPFAGSVALRHVDPGAVVVTGTPLLRLLGGGEPFVRFAVPPERADELTRGTVMQVRLDDPVRDGQRQAAIQAVVRQVSPEVDTAARMVFVEARFDPRSLAAEAAVGGAVRVAPLGAPCSAWEQNRVAPHTL